MMIKRMYASDDVRILETPAVYRVSSTHKYLV
jgi:hypothetical protein